MMPMMPTMMMPMMPTNEDGFRGTAVAYNTPYRNIQSFFIDEALRMNLKERNKLILQSVDQNSTYGRDHH